MTTQKRLEPSSYRAINRALRGFGYNIDENTSTEYANKLLDGERATNGPMMFIEGWLQKAKII